MFYLSFSMHGFLNNPIYIPAEKLWMNQLVSKVQAPYWDITF